MRGSTQLEVAAGSILPEQVMRDFGRVKEYGQRRTENAFAEMVMGEMKSNQRRLLKIL